MKLPVSYLLPGMVLARPVYGLKGELLLNKGVALTASHIFALRRRGVLAVQVQSSLPYDFMDAREVLEDEVRVQAMNAVRTWVERGRNRADFTGVVEQVETVVDEILSGKAPCGSLSEISSADIYTFTHSVDVCILSVAAGVKLGYGRNDLVKLGIGALLHDLGKTKVPPEILNKPDKLTDEEFAEIKKHPVWGYKMLLDEPDSRIDLDSLLVMLNHHEKYDGSGYPRSLKGKEIGVMAGICAAADMYNAITTDRVYRKALPPHEAYEMIAGAGGSLLDFQIVQAFLSCVEPYPAGSLVRLSTGDTACVVSVDPALPFRPVIVLIPSGEILDLKKELSVTITEPLPPDEARKIIQQGGVNKCSAALSFRL